MSVTSPGILGSSQNTDLDIYQILLSWHFTKELQENDSDVGFIMLINVKMPTIVLAELSNLGCLCLNFFLCFTNVCQHQRL